MGEDNIMNILITGGAGFIGTNLALKLISKGYCVAILDNLSPQIHGNDPKITSPLYRSTIGKVNFMKGTVTSRTDWEKAIIGQDVIVHLAAETGTGQSMYEIEKYTNVNIIGTALMLDILTNNSKHNVKKVVVASSRAIYGEGKYFCSQCGVVYPITRKDEGMKKGNFECKCPLCEGEVELRATDENSQIHPTSVYGITKQNQEQMVMTVCPTIGIAGMAFRYQNVYGPGQSLSNPYTGILSIFSTQIKNNNPINIFEDGKESRDFVYIDDVVDATILGIEKGEANNRIFNIGSGISTDVLKVAETLRSNYNSTVKINITGNYRVGDIRHNYADLMEIQKALNYTPSISFEEGIKRFCDWVDQQEIQEDKYELSIKEMQAKGLYK